MKHVMSERIRHSFAELSELTVGKRSAKLLQLMEIIASDLRKVVMTNDDDATVKLIGEHFNRAFPEETLAERAKLQAALTAKLALAMEEQLKNEDLPQSILNYYPMYFERMESDLRKNYLSPDFSPHKKYAGFLTVQNVPCGAQTADLKSCVPISSALLAVVRMRDIKPFFQYLAVEGTGVWFRSHTDSNYLGDFSKEGFDRYYLTIAELLKRRAHVRGLVATSWFLDPLLGEISPRLGYLFSGPMDRGAFYIKHRSTDFDVQQATKTSPTRRKACKEGGYIPTSYSLIWPREKLLSWADSFS